MTQTYWAWILYFYLKKKRREIKCREETEQDREVRVPEQVEEWVEAAVDEVKAVVVGAGEAALLQVPEVTACVPTVVKERPINWGPPVMSRNAQNAGPP